MSKYVIDDSTLSSIAEAIRAKTGGTEPIAVTDMAPLISSITGGGSSDEVILEEQSVSVTFRETLYLDHIYAPNPIAVGETYKVFWDATEYECTAISIAGTSFETYGSVAMGNTVLLNGTDNGVPFVIVYNATSASFMVVAIYATEPATHTLAIYKASGGGTIEGVCYVTFKNWDGTDLVTKPVFIGDHCTDPVDIDQIAEPTKESTNTQVFAYSGWSLTAGGSADNSALRNVTEDRTVYAAYTASTRYYTVRFFDGETLLHTVYAEYGSVPSYEPTKEGMIFDGWQPPVVPVVADADYYAQWKEKPADVYGVEWDYSQSSPALTRLGLSAGFSNPVPATSLTDAGSSPFDNIMPWAGMKRYNIINSAVSYSEDDAGFSMTDYDTTVYIPEFYYYAEKDEANTKWRWYISPTAVEGYTKHPGSGRYIGRYHTSGSSSAVFSKSNVQPLGGLTRANFRTYSHNKGNKWWMLDIATWSALQLLYLVEFANFDSQSMLGKGGGADSQALGSTDSAVYHTYNGGDTTNQYRWVEQPFGCKICYVDGLVFSSKNAYIGTDNSVFADALTGLTKANVALPTDGYITDFGYSQNFPWAFIPVVASGGSASTYVTDYVESMSSSPIVTGVGGSWVDSTSFGMFYFKASMLKNQASSSCSSRLIYIP